jgi:hypothetical protein
MSRRVERREGGRSRFDAVKWTKKKFLVIKLCLNVVTKPC